MIFLRDACVTWREGPELRAVLSLTRWLSSDFSSLLWIISTSPANLTPLLLYPAPPKMLFLVIEASASRFGACLVSEVGTPLSEPTTPISVSFTESSAAFDPFCTLSESLVVPSLGLREFTLVDASTSSSFESSADGLSLLARSTKSSVGSRINNGLSVLTGDETIAGV